MDIIFKPKDAIESQETLVNVLRTVKYKFRAINEYDNTRFHLITIIPSCSTFILWITAKLKIPYKAKTYEKEMSYSYIDCMGRYQYEPIVFNRDDVVKIVNDVPESYEGGAIL